MKNKTERLSPEQQYKAQVLQHRLQTLSRKLGTQVVSEYKFHPTRRWRFDFYLPQFKTAIEVEGGVFTNGRHTRGKGYKGDMEKYNTATSMGFRVLRFTPDELLSLQAIETIRKTMDNL